MRNVFLLFFIWLSAEMFGQTKTNANTVKPAPTDTIVRFGNRKIPVVKLYIGSTSVTYALQSKPDSSIRLEKKEIEKIIYKNGNVEPINKSVVEVIRNDQWQAIMVTHNESDVQGLYVLGEVRANASPNGGNLKKAKESTITRIQKKAAAFKGASYILITKDGFSGGYGNEQTYTAEGSVYGPEPPEKGTDVVKDKKGGTAGKK
jgi:hypothetical protein